MLLIDLKALYYGTSLAFQLRMALFALVLLSNFVESDCLSFQHVHWLSWSHCLTRLYSASLLVPDYSSRVVKIRATPIEVTCWLVDTRLRATYGALIAGRVPLVQLWPKMSCLNSIVEAEGLRWEIQTQRWWSWSRISNPALIIHNYYATSKLRTELIRMKSEIKAMPG